MKRGTPIAGNLADAVRGTGFAFASSPGPAGGGAGALAVELGEGERLAVLLGAASPGAVPSRVVAAADVATVRVERGPAFDAAAVALLPPGEGARLLAPGSFPVELLPGDIVLVAAPEEGRLPALRAALAAPGWGRVEGGLGKVVARLAEAPGAVGAIGLLYDPWEVADGEAFRAFLRFSPGAVARTREALTSFCEARQVPEPVVHDVAVALEETLDNVFEHAYRDRPGGAVVVEGRIRGGEFVLTVRDRGPAFDPRDATAPDLTSDLEERRVGGLGLHLVRALVDDVRHERRGGENRLVLVKELPPA